MNEDRPSVVLIAALDVDDGHQALKLAYSLRGLVATVKVGLRLFVATGPRLVRELRELGFEVFLDLKLHDIPTVVEAAARTASALGVKMLTVHASGGSEMVRAAVAGAGDECDVIAVTVLTSFDEASQIAIFGDQLDTEQRILGWAVISIDAGAKGLVCSPQEVAVLAKHFSARSPSLHFVTPGIHPAESQASDPTHVATPTQAIAAGATHLVIGRALLEADEPHVAIKEILAEIAEAMKGNPAEGLKSE